MVEIDRQVVTACKQYLPIVSGNLSDPRVEFIFADGVAFAKTKKNEYDVIIVDSSDPVGPAEVLFKKSFYQSLYQALKQDGIMVCQSQSPIFHKKIMNQTYQHIGELFPHVKRYTAVVPTYPGGLWSFTIGSKQYTEPVPSKVDNKETKYVNSEVVTSCFALPQFVLKQ